MSTGRFDRVQKLFDEAVDRSAAERRIFLEETCGDDRALADEVRALLEADDAAGGILDASVGVPDQALVAKPEPAELPEGTVLDQYAITQVIGSGSFGSVYRAKHRVIGKEAAIKVLHAEHASSGPLGRRFINEARAVNEIGHPNIIDIFGFGQTDDGRLFYVMELLDAPSLHDVLRQDGALSPEHANGVLRGLAAALDAAHDQGIVHRDLKPANVVVQLDADGRYVPTLLDFGIAKLRNSGLGPVDATGTGELMGTPAYMAPEQIRQKEVGGAADVYAFGVLAYRVLTGRLPFQADNAFDMLACHTSAVPDPPSRHCPELAPEIDRAILQMLDKDPSRRPSGLADAVDAMFGGGAGFAAVGGPVASTSSLGRWVVPFGLVCIVAGVVGLWAWAGSPTQDNTASAAAQRRGAAIPASVPASPASAPEPPKALAATPAGASPIVLRVTGPPEGTQVLDPQGELLGAAPGTIHLRRSDEPVQLRFVHPKRGERVQVLTPDHDQDLEFTWRKRGHKKKKTGIHRDLESPFGK